MAECLFLAWLGAVFVALAVATHGAASRWPDVVVGAAFVAFVAVLAAPLYTANDDPDP
jgi:hypothetical protein